MSGVLGSFHRRRHVVVFVYKSWGTCAPFGYPDCEEGLTAGAFWTGQIRPVCDLAAHMVKLRAVAITLLTTATFYDRIQNEIKRNFNADDIHRMLYIR